LEQEVPAVRGPDRTAVAAKLDAIHGIPRRRRIGGIVGVTQGFEQLRGILGEVLGHGGQLVCVGGRIAVVLHALRHGTVAPLGRTAAIASPFDVDGFVPLGRTVVEELERKPQGFGGAVAGFGVFDGDVVRLCLHVERARSDGETHSGAGAARAEGAAHDRFEVQCQTACDRKQWNVSLLLGTIDDREKWRTAASGRPGVAAVVGYDGRKPARWSKNMHESALDQYRYFLKDTIRQEIDFSQTDQNRGVSPPPVEKPLAPGANRVDLPPVDKQLGKLDLATAIGNRESRRSFTAEPLTLGELSFLLWATQGVRQRLASGTVLRTVPSAGNRHALETYLAALHVKGVEPGFYRYLPLEHQLLHLFHEEQMPRKLTEATLGQAFVGRSAVVFIWTAIPYRMEWRYGLAAHKVIAVDAGHVCQNLYLACEAIGAGTCAVAAYHQQLMDRLVRLDGQDEFVIYLAPVGKL
jgi:SagB-type dehydrogenase family enzyme